jgi:pimeloyl-ACP methyl ester carboxylesterase
MIGAALRLFGRVVGWLLLLTLVVLAGLRLAAWWREGPVTPPPGMTMVSTAMGQVAVQLSGPEDGRRIALVHGSAAWSGFWRDVATDLSAKGWRVIAIDTPPFGYSARDPLGRYDRVSQARRLGDVLRNSGGPAVVLGHSFGAGAATELALTEPTLVERLVLVDAAMGTIDPPSGAGPGTASELLAFAPLGQAVTAAAITNPPMLHHPQGGRRAVGRNARRTDAARGIDHSLCAVAADAAGRRRRRAQSPLD